MRIRKNPRLFLLSLASLASFFALVSLSACMDLSSSQATARTAYEAVDSGDLATFDKTLTGSALQDYGNAAGMAELNKQLANNDPYTYVPTLLSSVQDSCGHDIERVYSQGVWDGNNARPILDLTVKCAVSYAPTDPTASCAEKPLCGLPIAAPPLSSSPCGFRVLEDCRISQISNISAISN